MSAKSKRLATFSSHERGIAHLFLLFVVIIAAIGAVGYLAYQNAQLKQQAEETTTTPKTTDQQASPTPDGSAITADWDTYINNEASYLIKYPSNWEFNTYENNIYTGHSTFKYKGADSSFLGEIKLVDPAMLRGETWRNLTAEDFYNVDSDFWLVGKGIGGGPGTDYSQPVETHIGNQKVIMQNTNYSTIYENVGPWINTIFYYIPYNNSVEKLISITFFVDERNTDKEKIVETFNQILSTFQFLE